MHNYLEALLLNKKREVAALKERDDLKQAVVRSSSKSFKKALSMGNAVIAEIKRQSPSKNHLAEIADPVALAKSYSEGGAAAISVLTDSQGFGGSIDDLKNVAEALSSTPVVTLRKDFIIDRSQIAEAVLAGADAVLLIIAALNEKTGELLDVARSMNIDAVIEVMNSEELNYALSLSPEIILVNNRNLTTFEVDTNSAFQLKASIPDSVISIAASGVDAPQVASQYFDAGFHAVLIGEALVRSNNPAQFIHECFVS